MSDDNTIGEFRFGLDSSEAHARYSESLYRELAVLDGWGEVPAGTTFASVADVIMDTIINYSGMGPIPATELPTLVLDALEQLKSEEE